MTLSAPITGIDWQYLPPAHTLRFDGSCDTAEEAARWSAQGELGCTRIVTLREVLAAPSPDWIWEAHDQPQGGAAMARRPMTDTEHAERRAERAEQAVRAHRDALEQCLRAAALTCASGDDDDRTVELVAMAQIMAGDLRDSGVR